MIKYGYQILNRHIKTLMNPPADGKKLYLYSDILQPPPRREAHTVCVHGERRWGCVKPTGQSFSTFHRKVFAIALMSSSCRWVYQAVCPRLGHKSLVNGGVLQPHRLLPHFRCWPLRSGVASSATAPLLDEPPTNDVPLWCEHVAVAANDVAGPKSNKSRVNGRKRTSSLADTKVWRWRSAALQSDLLRWRAWARETENVGEDTQSQTETRNHMKQKVTGQTQSRNRAQLLGVLTQLLRIIDIPCRMFL